MTYLQFVLVFLVAPAALLLALHGARHLRLLFAAVGVAAVLALIYTAPWGYLLVHNGVWQFDRSKSGAALWGIPWEGYVAIVVQTLFTGTLVAVALRRPWGRR